MFKKSLLIGTSAIMAAAMAIPAHAQDVNVPDDEVIVTATKRATTLQDAPLAVSVTNELTIERANILDINDLQSVVPSLRINQLQSAQNTNFIIRGFGNGANNAGIEPSVGVFIDGVYRSRSAARIGDLPKLSRIEVLPGPQSTLFGKNASAGVISIVSAAPSFDTEGYVELGYGNYNSITGKAYVTGPVSDTLAYSVGGNFNKRDGYAKSAVAGLKDVNDRDRYSLRGQLLFEPNDDWSMRLIGDYSSLDENCCHVSNFVASPISGLINGIGAANGFPQSIADFNDPFAYISYQNKDSINTLTDYGISLQTDVATSFADITSITSYRENDSFYDTDADYSLNRSLDFVDSDQQINTFTQELRVTSNSDSDLSWMVGGFMFIEEVNQNAGLGYGVDLRSYIDALAGGPTALAVLELFDGQAPGTFFGDQAETNEFFTQDNDAYSLFGTVDYEVGDRLTLSGGVNYTEDKKNVSGFTINSDLYSDLDLINHPGTQALALGAIQAAFNNPADPIYQSFAATFGGTPLTAFTFTNIDTLAMFPGAQALFVGGVTAGTAAALEPLQFQPQFLAFPNAVENGRTTDDKVTWAISANYEINDNINAYARVATGFKSSSWNLSRDSRPTIGNAAALQAAGLLPNNYIPATGRNFGTRFAGPEDSIVYEAGLKTKFDNGTFNITGFQQTLQDFQSNAFIGAAFVLTNAGETEVNGVEADLNYRIFDGLTINAAGTYLDAKFTDYQNASGPVAGVSIDRTGETPDNVSDLSLSIGGTYEHDFDNGMSGYVRADWQYESDATISRNLDQDALALAAAANPAYTTLGFYPGYDKRNQSIFNASAGIEFENGVALQVWGRNLFNDKYVSTLFPGVAQFGVVNGYPSPPRVYGANARVNF